MKRLIPTKRTIIFAFLYLGLWGICSLLLRAQFRANYFVKTKPGADVYLDGIKKGSADASGDFTLEDLAAGSYTITVKKDGYDDNSQTKKVNGMFGDTFYFELTAVTQPVQPNLKQLQQQLQQQEIEAPKVEDSAIAYIYINCPIAGGEVFIDGISKGRTDEIYNQAIPTQPGMRKVEIKKSGYKTVTRRIDVNPRSNPTYSFQLRERGGGFGTTIIVVLFLSLLAGTIFLLARVVGDKNRVRFDRYIIHDIIGRGGMATIYRAKDTTTKQIVALKILDPAFQGDADMVKKFIKEGWVLSEINQESPSAPVVKVFNYGRENNRTKGRPFIAMEYLPGKDLLYYIKGRTVLNLNFVFKIIEQIATALAVAHKKGVYHRDVTPDNVIVVKNDADNPVAKLIDFGVARHEYTSVGTLDGSISGKPPYMSPEQCRCEKVDARSDIYSLGILFYSLIEGHPPFVSKNPFEVMKQHEEAAVPPIKREISSGIIMIINKMLAKNKNDRFVSMAEFLAEMKREVGH